MADEEGYLLSASTDGEERWLDLVISEESENGFLPGHAYAILQVKEYKNNGLLNIRNPWGNFEWYLALHFFFFFLNQNILNLLRKLKYFICIKKGWRLEQQI